MSDRWSIFVAETVADQFRLALEGVEGGQDAINTAIEETTRIVSLLGDSEINYGMLHSEARMMSGGGWCGGPPYWEPPKWEPHTRILITKYE